MKPFRKSRDYEGKFALTTLQNPFLDVTPRFDSTLTETKRADAPAEPLIDAHLTDAPPEIPEPAPVVTLQPESAKPIQPETAVAEATKISTERIAMPENEAVIAAPVVPAELPTKPPHSKKVRAKKQRPITPASFLPESDLSELERHRRKCAICNHPFRRALEEDFINWGDVGRITRVFEIEDSRGIYRHAHATGLFERRRQNVRFAAELVVERVSDISTPAPETILSAIRTITRLNDRGEWHEPTSHVIVSSGRQLTSDHQNPNSAAGPDSNRQFSDKLARLETPSK